MFSHSHLLRYLLSTTHNPAYLLVRVSTSLTVVIIELSPTTCYKLRQLDPLIKDIPYSMIFSFKTAAAAPGCPSIRA